MTQQVFSRSVLYATFILSFPSLALAGPYADIGLSHGQLSEVATLYQDQSGTQLVNLAQGVGRFSTYQFGLGVGYSADHLSATYLAVGAEVIVALSPGNHDLQALGSATLNEVGGESYAPTKVAVEEQPWADMYLQYGIQEPSYGALYLSAGTQLAKQKRGGAVFLSGNNAGKTAFDKTMESSMSTIPMLGLGYRSPIMHGAWSLDWGFDYKHYFATDFEYHGVKGTNTPGQIDGSTLDQSFLTEVSGHNDMWFSMRWHI